MKSRKEYIEEMKSSLKDINTELKSLQSKAKIAGRNTAAKVTAIRDAARPRIIDEIKFLKAKKNDLEVRIDALKGPSKAAWKDLKVAIDLAWTDLKDGISSAQMHFRKEVKQTRVKPKTKAQPNSTSTKAKKKSPRKKIAKKKPLPQKSTGTLRARKLSE